MNVFLPVKLADYPVIFDSLKKKKKIAVTYKYSLLYVKPMKGR